MHRSIVIAVLVSSALTAPVLAQRGDRGNQEQPEVWKKMDVPAAPPLSPEDAMKTFKIAPGFRLELVASEPLIEDPVAMDWDAAGRLYVVEMRGYMPNVDGTGEDARIGRVVRLEDTDGDGRMDKSVVFLDELQMPRAVAVLGDGGVLVGEPPHLWLCRDTDGDGKADSKTGVYDQYGKQGPVEHTDNGLLQAIDNWVYNAKSDKRFHVTGDQLLMDKTNGRGQWGISQDNYGRLYHNSNSSYLSVDSLPAEYFQGNAHHGGRSGMSQGVVRDQSVWSIRVNPGVNRGYQGGTLKGDGRLNRTTAVSGQMIYRGDQFGDDFVGDAFIPEPAGNVVAHFDVTTKGQSISGEQSTYQDDKWQKRAFLASTDERFRPVSAYNGPDGGVYIVDMYRGILQHKVYVTTFLRKQILERKLDKPVGMGRIYRIVRDDRPVDRKTPELAALSSDKLAPYLADANGWTRDMAQRILVARADASAAPAIRKVLADKSNALGQIHAMWTLAGMNALEPADAIAGMSSGDEQLVIATLRAATPAAILNHTRDESWAKYAALDGPVYAAAGGDPKLEVTPHAVAAAGTLTTVLHAGKPEAIAALLGAVAGHLDSSMIRDIVYNALPGRELAIARFAGTDKVAGGTRQAVFKEVGRIVMSRGNAGEIEALLALAAGAEANDAVALLDGMSSWSKKPKKQRLSEQPASLAAMLKSKDKKLASFAKKVDAEWLVYGDADAGGPRALSGAEQKLYDIGKQHYTLICAACHQPHGKGQAGLAPTLVDSDWVTEDPAVTTRIVLHGLMGPITVNDEEWNLVMPGHALNPMFTDEVTAGVLTYIRREWGNDADPVTADFVKQIRAASKGRVEPWTVEQLKKAK